MEICLTLSRPAKIGNACAKTTGSHVALRRNFSGPVSASRPGHRLKRRDKSFSLQIFFLGGCGFFMSDVLSGGLLGHLGLLYLALGANR